MPSGQIDKPLIEDNRDGTVSIKYDPREEGIHELAVKYNGEHVQGSPVSFIWSNSFYSTLSPLAFIFPKSTNSTWIQLPLGT